VQRRSDWYQCERGLSLAGCVGCRRRQWPSWSRWSSSQRLECSTLWNGRSSLRSQCRCSRPVSSYQTTASTASKTISSMSSSSECRSVCPSIHIGLLNASALSHNTPIPCGKVIWSVVELWQHLMTICLHGCWWLTYHTDPVVCEQWVWTGGWHTGEMCAAQRGRKWVLCMTSVSSVVYRGVIRLTWHTLMY